MARNALISEGTPQGTAGANAGESGPAETYVRQKSALLTGAGSRDTQDFRDPQFKDTQFNLRSGGVAGGIRFLSAACRLFPLAVLLLFSKGWPWSISEQDENHSIRHEFR